MAGIQLFRKTALFAILVFASGHTFASPANSTSLSFYNQTLYDQEYLGWASESRARFAYSLVPETLDIYAGLQFSRSDSSIPYVLMADNYWAPVTGGRFKLLEFITLFAEHRWIHRSDHRPNLERDTEWRYGLYGYKKFALGKIFENSRFFHEVYYEGVAIPRIDSSLAFFMWNKVGAELVEGSIVVSGFVEGQISQSPNRQLRITEQDLRLGARVGWNGPGVWSQILIMQSLWNSREQEHWEGLFTFGGQF